ncbi:hypothetical protein BJX76DRAFT_144952 [Aspergillus varians]
MLPRSRSFLNKCGLSTIRADPAAGRGGPHSDEPLLFLYPRWFTSTVREQRRSINTALCRRNISHHHPGEILSRTPTHRSPSRKQSFGASSSRRWLSRGSTPQLPKTGSDEAVDPISEVGVSPAATRIKTAKQGKSTSALGENGIFNAFAQGGIKGYDEIDSALVEHNWDILLEPGDKHSQGDSSPDAVRKRRALLRQLPPHQARKILRRQHYLEGMTSKERLSLYNGIRPLLELAEERAKNARFRRPSFFTERDPQRREILVPDETVAALAGVSEKFSPSENIWFVWLRHGCRVHVLPPVESDGPNRKVVLWGPPRALELVANHFLKTQEQQDRGDPLVEVRKPPVPVIPSRLALERSGTHTPLIRSVWNHRSSSQLPTGGSLLGTGSESISTVRGFMEYVEALTTSGPPAVSSGLPHPTRVAKALWELFCNEDKQHMMSTMALNTAISFLLRHNFLHCVPDLFDRAGHVATTQTFNILLKSVAQRQNLPFFCRVLRMMGRARTRPDVYTWLAYLECLVSPAAKTALIKVIAKKGYLQDPYVMRSVFRLMANELFTNHLKHGGSVDEFFNTIANTDGLNWFPPSLIRKMIVVTVQLGNVSATKRLLEICKENNLLLSSEMIHEMIRLFPNDTFTTVDYTVRCLENPKAKLSQKVYERLYLNARRNMHYNICRVLWIYACMDGLVSRSMRDDLILLIHRNLVPEGIKEREKLWWTCAGKVIVGVDLHLPNYPLKDDLLTSIPPEFHDNPVASLFSPRPLEKEELKKQRDATRAIVKHDIEIGSWYRPTYPLAHMLEAAAELDREWGDVPRPAKWLMQHAIQVPVEFAGHNLGD